MGMKAAAQDYPLLKRQLLGAKLVFICAGLGGGTGTGASQIIASIAKKQKATVIALVSYPLHWRVRQATAEEGLKRLEASCDGILLKNDMMVRLFPDMNVVDAFHIMSEIDASNIRLSLQLMVNTEKERRNNNGVQYGEDNRRFIHKRQDAKSDVAHNRIKYCINISGVPVEYKVDGVYPIADDYWNNDPGRFVKILKSMDKQIKAKNTPILIMCHAGVSRSPTIVALFLL